MSSLTDEKECTLQPKPNDFKTNTDHASTYISLHIYKYTYARECDREGMDLTRQQQVHVTPQNHSSHFS